MLNKLKKHYKDSITTNLVHQTDYVWFITHAGEPFGIRRSTLSDSELKLLSSMFENYKVETSITYSTAQQKWKDLISGRTINETIEFYRYIHFFSKQPVSDYFAFSEAVNGLFPDETVLLLNEDQLSGVIIETSKQDVNDTPYEALKDMLSTDFYIDLNIYLGSYNNEQTNAKQTYERERAQFLLIKNNLPPKSIYTTADAIPLLLLQDSSSQLLETLQSSLAEWMNEDKETLSSIKVFVECNMNISLAAKKLYIHRNSLQYRVDKFFDKTGIDVKQFKNALTVYMAILSLEQNKDQ
ncbi:helix-turn-helix domain-containing protein [Bacillus sp. NEB1478]|uniref:PucR family transcriptional regulator n=1 Tax=Bacillus sp. NEB1478 TaxID=3073816 RepID=UPI0028736E07|nr:helix-turn-helix domain-containing protein [Bacillus sp. NEB1478]WNB91469.1 helix-turn-helix domain-containing protein [Bacillus sp. NEB1478]